MPHYSEREVSLFRNGRNQAVPIPREFELEGDKALMYCEGDKLIIEPFRKGKLLSLLATLHPLDDVFQDVDNDFPFWTTHSFGHSLLGILRRKLYRL